MKIAVSHWQSRSPLTQCWRYRAARDVLSRYFKISLDTDSSVSVFFRHRRKRAVETIFIQEAVAALLPQTDRATPDVSRKLEILSTAAQLKEQVVKRIHHKS